MRAWSKFFSVDRPIWRPRVAFILILAAILAGSGRFSALQDSRRVAERAEALNRKGEAASLELKSREAFPRILKENATLRQSRERDALETERV